MNRLLTALWLVIGLALISAPLAPAQAAYKIGDLACEASADTGTGALDLDGAYANYQDFIAAGIANGDTFPYHMRVGTGLATTYETGTATFTDGTPDSISRSVEESSDGAATALDVQEAAVICIGFTSAHFIGDKGDITVSANNVWSIDADSVALGTDTTGNYVAEVGDGTGIDGVCTSEGCTYTPTLDLTELNTFTLGAGSATGIIFDAGATDPAIETASGSLTIDIGGTNEAVISASGLDPGANDGGRLGVLGTAWSDLALADGGVIALGASGSQATITHTAASDSITIAADPDNATATSQVVMSVDGTNELILNPTNLTPGADGGNSLGTTALGWQNLFRNTGFVDNWENGDCLLTHSSNSLALTGGCVLTSDSSLDLSGVTTATLTASGANLLVEGTIVKKVGKETIWVPAGAMTPQTTNGCAAATNETATNDVMFKTLNCDTSTQEGVQFNVAFPKNWNSGTLSGQVFWSHPSTATNFGAEFDFACLFLPNDGALDQAFGTAVEVGADTGGTTDDIYVTSETGAVQCAGTEADDGYVTVRVRRVPADGSDNLAVDARIHGVKLFFTVDAANDD